MNTLFTNQDDPIQIDPDKDYYPELVGEGRKYKDNKAFARSRMEADAHIQRLEREQAESRSEILRLKEETNAVPRLQELIDRLSEAPLSTTPQVPEVKQPAIDPQQIESIVDSRLKTRDSQRTEQNNINEVMGKLKERYGNNYQGVLKQTATDLDLSDEEINALARRSPKAFFRTLGLDQVENKETFQTPPRSSQRSDNFAPATQTRNYVFYDKMRKDNPDLYWQPKTQKQLHLDSVALGDAF